MKAPLSTPRNKQNARIKNNVRPEENSALRDTVLESIDNDGLRETMIAEYHELAAVNEHLLGLLQAYRFAESLSPCDLETYADLMRRLGLVGRRCQILVRESRTLDRKALMATVPTVSQRVN